MINTSKLSWALALGASLALGGCWGSDDNNDSAPVVVTPPVVTPPVVVPPVVVVPQPEVLAFVPDSAGVSVAAFISYLLGSSASDETSQALTFNAGFAVPADETSEPQALR